MFRKARYDWIIKFHSDFCKSKLLLSPESEVVSEAEKLENIIYRVCLKFHCSMPRGGEKGELESYEKSNKSIKFFDEM
jgi:hypothetical protein